MKRSWRICLLLAAVLAPVTWAAGQSSLEMLQRDLDQFKQEHQQAASKNLNYFFTSLQNAEGSPEAAEKLYVDAGGKPPDRAKVITNYEHETPTEEAARTALDQATMSGFDGSVQMHCGMMRLAALLVTQPKSASLSEQWLAWLKSAAQTYPQIVVSVKDSRKAADKNGNDHEDSPPPDVGAQVRNMAMNASIISDYLDFHGWGDKDEGKWRVADIPKLYNEQILEPLRHPPTAATLAAWDTYIAMMNADQPDAQKWTDVDYPALQFERGIDDFTSAPNTEKLEALVNLMKAHPTHPKIDDWIAQVHDLIKGYQGERETAEAPAAAATTNLPPIPPDAPPPPAVGVPTTANTPPPAH